MKKILVVFGTRPEAIKMIPVVKMLRSCPEYFEVKVCSTGQHRQMLDQVLEFFDLKTDFDLDVMQPEQSITDVTCKVLNGMENVFAQWLPDIILVQGDTTTVMATSLAAFYHKIKIAHVEAGLRTHDRYSPFPEEMNRQIAAKLADIHFAPTESSKNNLLQEAINPMSVYVTGNTVIDALLEAINIMNKDPELLQSIQNKFSFLDPTKKMILVTGHRRESFGRKFSQICNAVKEISLRDDVQVVFPVHHNPNVREPAERILGNCGNVFLLSPQDYPSFIYLMRRSYLILTDSGGVQEEAPSLGKPVVVMRNTTERPEAVDAGTVIVAGTDKENICRNVFKLLDNVKFYLAMSRAVNPYGDGRASWRISELLKS